MTDTAQAWDRAAPDYQRVYRLGLNEYNTRLLRFWEENGMLFPGARVLDIGCGVGKYGAWLAELGYDVTLTDISGEMLRRAEENMAKFRTPWAVYQCDFNEVTGREPVFADGFDLAISTMSPAIHDAETVRKMSAMTRGFCFLVRFSAWEQPFRDELMRRMGLEPQQPQFDLKADCAGMIEAVREERFVPQVKVVDYNWSDGRTPEQMADYLLRRYFDGEADPEEKRAAALRAARELADADGLVRDGVNTKVAWIWWNAKERRA